MKKINDKNNKMRCVEVAYKGHYFLQIPENWKYAFLFYCYEEKDYIDYDYDESGRGFRISEDESFENLDNSQTKEIQLNQTREFYQSNQIREFSQQNQSREPNQFNESTFQQEESNDNKSNDQHIEPIFSKKKERFDIFQNSISGLEEGGGGEGEVNLDLLENEERGEEEEIKMQNEILQNSPREEEYQQPNFVNCCTYLGIQFVEGIRPKEILKQLYPLLKIPCKIILRSENSFGTIIGHHTGFIQSKPEICAELNIVYPKDFDPEEYKENRLAHCRTKNYKVCKEENDLILKSSATDLVKRGLLHIRNLTEINLVKYQFEIMEKEEEFEKRPDLPSFITIPNEFIPETKLQQQNNMIYKIKQPLTLKIDFNQKRKHFWIEGPRNSGKTSFAKYLFSTYRCAWTETNKRTFEDFYKNTQVLIMDAVSPISKLPLDEVEKICDNSKELKIKYFGPKQIGNVIFFIFSNYPLDQVYSEDPHRIMSVRFEEIEFYNVYNDPISAVQTWQLEDENNNYRESEDENNSREEEDENNNYREQCYEEKPFKGLGKEYDNDNNDEFLLQQFSNKNYNNFSRKTEMTNVENCNAENRNKENNDNNDNDDESKKFNINQNIAKYDPENAHFYQNYNNNFLNNGYLNYDTENKKCSIL